MPHQAGRIPISVDLKLYAGDSAWYALSLPETVDPTGGRWAAQIKPEGAAAVIAAFDVTVDPQGRVVLSLDAVISQRLGGYGKQKLRWDLQQTFDDSTVTTHVKGLVLVSPDVTPVPELSAAPVPVSTALFTEAGEKLLTESGAELVA